MLVFQLLWWFSLWPSRNRRLMRLLMSSYHWASCPVRKGQQKMMMAGATKEYYFCLSALGWVRGIFGRLLFFPLQIPGSAFFPSPPFTPCSQTVNARTLPLPSSYSQPLIARKRMCVYVCVCVCVRTCVKQRHTRWYLIVRGSVCLVCRVWGDMTIKEMRGECQRFYECCFLRNSCWWLVC